MAVGLTRRAALAMRRELMMDAVLVEMQLLVCRELLVDLRGRSSALGRISR